MSKKKISLFRYRHALPQILLYQLISKAILGVGLYFFGQLTGLLLWSLDRPAFTSGDLPYLMRSWQGWLLLVCGFIALLIYTVFDIHATILLADRLLKGMPVKALTLLKDAFAAVPRLKGRWGVLAVLYVSLITPLTLGGLNISLTSDLTVPDFIMSVIQSKTPLLIAYTAGMTVLGLLGLAYIFTFHFVLLEKYPIREAMRASCRLMKKHWPGFLARYALFILKAAAFLTLIILLCYGVPAVVIHLLDLTGYFYQACIIFITLITAAALGIWGLMFLYLSMMKLTLLFREYNGQEAGAGAAFKKHRAVMGAIATTALLFLLVFSLGAATEFDLIFPAQSAVDVIAHRGGGTLANENTVLSLEAAIAHHAAGSEIDVQRTADGAYIINHDSDFRRCCGDPRTPGEMTLEEIRQLKVVNASDPDAPAVPVATIEEMLDAAKGRIHLYIELKGSSADDQMAEDLYQMVLDREMLDECTFICLSYGVLERLEAAHPDARTGYLCYFSFGEIEKMSVDVLLLEAETATAANISRIHAAGKQAAVWTVNDMTAMTRFMCSEADAVITDEVAQADQVRRLLAERPDEVRVLSVLLPE